VSEERVRLDAQTLRGIAHPLRLRLLNLLREDGPSTATRLAERTGESSGSTSYHLRQLALYGFVEEDPRTGGRERWWRAVHRGNVLEAEDIQAAPDEAEAYLRTVAAQYADRVQRWLHRAPALLGIWDRAATLSDWRLRLTPAEGERFLTAFEALIAEYRRDDPGAPAPEDAERVHVQLQLMPFVEEGDSS